MFSECEMFKDCGADFMREFLHNCQDNAWGQIVDNGVQLIKEGEIGHSMYIIHRGSVTVDLKGTKVATLGAGAVLQAFDVGGAEGCDREGVPGRRKHRRIDQRGSNRSLEI